MSSISQTTNRETRFLSPSLFDTIRYRVENPTRTRKFWKVGDAKEHLEERNKRELHRKKSHWTGSLCLVEEKMATASTERSRPEPTAEEKCTAKTKQQGEGLKMYYLQHIQDLQLQVRQKNHNLNRLEAQRNDLNSRGRNFLPSLCLLHHCNSVGC